MITAPQKVRQNQIGIPYVTVRVKGEVVRIPLIIPAGRIFPDLSKKAPAASA